MIGLVNYLATLGHRAARDADDDLGVAMLDVDEPVRRGTFRPVCVAPRVRRPLPLLPPKPVYVGDPHGEPEMLILMWKYWVSRGFTGPNLSPREFCTLPKLPGRPVAIPPPVTWPWMADMLAAVWPRLRAKTGPMTVRGYRPPKYNKKVKGSPRSRHMWGQAMDLRVTSANMLDVLKLESAKLWLEKGSELKMGLGVYAGNVHVDVGHRKRIWGSEWRKWIKEARE